MARSAAGAGYQRLVSPERAIATLEGVAAQAEALARRLRTALLDAQANMAALVAVKSAPRGRRGPGRPAGPRRRSARGSGAGAMAWQILKEWGRSARSAEILDELKARGVVVGGKNPKQTLNSTLLKYPGIDREGRGLFFAKGDGPGAPTPAAGAGRRARKAAKAAGKGRGKGKGRKGKRAAEAATESAPPAEAGAQS